MNYHLAQLNVARMKGKNIDDPLMKSFVDNLDAINTIAENSDGFVWRLKDDSDSAAYLNPYQNEQMIVNLSVWKDVDSLKVFTYKTPHAKLIRDKKQWFTNFDKPHMVLWWIKNDTLPTLEQAISKLEYLQKNGPSAQAFTFKNVFPAPID